MRTRECVRCKHIFDCKGKETTAPCLRFEDRHEEESAEIKMVDVDFRKEIKTLKPQNDV